MTYKCVFLYTINIINKTIYLKIEIFIYNCSTSVCMKGTRTINIDVEVWDRFIEMYPRRASEMINDYISDMVSASDTEFDVDDQLQKTAELEKELFTKKSRLLAIKKEQEAQSKKKEVSEVKEQQERYNDCKDYWNDLSDYDKVGIKYRAKKYNLKNNKTLSDFEFFMLEKEEELNENNQ